MTISAQIVAHSRHPFRHFGPKDVVTFLLRYPRFIHAEVMTHRAFSRNASSSRAIPVERLIADVLADTAMPSHWGRNQAGMQAREEHDELIRHEAVSPLDMLDNTFDGVTPQQAWIKARDKAVGVARAFARANYHKQVANRLLEPFAHINVVVTATDFDNFFHLRRHPDAQPEIKILADRMYEALQTSTGRLLRMDEWHLPFVTGEDRVIPGATCATGDFPEDFTWASTADLLKISAARCARTSYMTHDGRRPSVEDDLKLYDRLVGASPLHASPTEHQAKPEEPYWSIIDEPAFKTGQSGNLGEGWRQYRKTLSGESCADYAATQQAA